MNVNIYEGIKNSPRRLYEKNDIKGLPIQATLPVARSSKHASPLKALFGYETILNTLSRAGKVKALCRGIRTLPFNIKHQIQEFSSQFLSVEAGERSSLLTFAPKVLFYATVTLEDLGESGFTI